MTLQPPFKVMIFIFHITLDIKGFLTSTLKYIFKIFKSEAQCHSDISSFQCDWSGKINSAFHSCGFQFQKKIARKYVGCLETVLSNQSSTFLMLFDTISFSLLI